MMTTTHADDTTVISLESHRASRSARRRSLELRDAMRRHPSFQIAPTREESESFTAVVLTIPSR